MQDARSCKCLGVVMYSTYLRGNNVYFDFMFWISFKVGKGNYYRFIKMCRILLAFPAFLIFLIRSR